MMKSRLLRAAFLLVPFAGVLYYGITEQADRPVLIGEVAPDFSVSSLEGTPLQLQQYRGKVVVLNFWATWCPPCVTEMPSLERLANLDEKIAVLTISVDEDPETLRQFVAEHGLTLAIARDPERRLAVRYGTYKYPESYIIGPGGKLHEKMFGAIDWDEPRLREHLFALARRAQPRRS